MIVFDKIINIRGGGAGCRKAAPCCWKGGGGGCCDVGGNCTQKWLLIFIKIQ